jgi:hypothetical protein
VLREKVEVTLADERTALPDTRAAEIGAISRQRLRYWEKTVSWRPSNSLSTTSPGSNRIWSSIRWECRGA